MRLRRLALRRAGAAVLTAWAGLSGLGGLGAAARAAPASVSGSASDARPLKVVASFSILGDLVAQVGGPMVQVQTLVGPDGDAHAFEPTPQSVRQLAQADLVVVNGLHYEGWLERLVQTSGYRGPLVTASQGITPFRLGREVDPHAWQDLAHVRRYAQNMADALIRARPAARAGIEIRLRDLLARLDALDQRIRAALAKVPTDRRRVVTTHDAFGYFGRAYGIEFLSVQGWNSQGEASAAAVGRLIQQLRRQKASAVFVENISDPRLIQRLAQEAGAKVGGTLYSDALSRPGTEADTFLKFFEHNARTLLSALDAQP